VLLFVGADGYSETGWSDRGDLRGEGVDGDSVAVREGVESTVTARLDRAGSLRVALNWAGDTPDWEGITVGLVRPEEGEVGSSWDLEVERGVAKVGQLEPGGYEIRFRFDGEAFEEVKPIPVHIVAGETTRIEVPLVRRR
jgi:hypothetical protein